MYVSAHFLKDHSIKIQISQYQVFYCVFETIKQKPWVQLKHPLCFSSIFCLGFHFSFLIRANKEGYRIEVLPGKGNVYKCKPTHSGLPVPCISLTQVVGISPTMLLLSPLGEKNPLFTSGNYFCPALKMGIFSIQRRLKTISESRQACLHWTALHRKLTHRPLPGKRGGKHSHGNKCSFQRCKGLAERESGGSWVDIENNVFFLPCQSFSPDISCPLHQWH